MIVYNKKEAGERLTKIIEDSGLNSVSFAQRIDTDPSYLSKMESGKKGISKTALENIEKEFRINRQWILFGTLPKEFFPNENNGQNVPHDTNYFTKEPEEFYGHPGVTMVDSQSDVKDYLKRRRDLKNGEPLQKPIPVYDVDVAAGKADITLVDDKNVAVPVDYLYVPEFAGCVAVNVYSDSMAPLLNPGSRMFIKKIDDWQNALEYGQVYIVSLQDGRRFLKYVKRSAKEETHLLLHSHNSHYDDFEVPRRMVKSIWIVDGWMNKHTQSTFQFLKP